jgi:hypothetical protein
LTSQLLLLAEPLNAAGLSRWIEDSGSDLTVVGRVEALQGPPAIVLWAPAASMAVQSLQREVTLLRERWQPAPLLLVLAEGHGLAPADLLLLASEGLLEAPESSQLNAALSTLLGGGRVLELQAATRAGAPVTPQEPGARATANLGQALLLSGLQQLDIASSGCRLLLSRPNIHPLARLMLEGRLREMALARRFLLWLWGPVSMAWATATEPLGHWPGTATGLATAKSHPAATRLPAGH